MTVHAVRAEDAFQQGYRPFGTANHRRVEPAVQAAQITQHRRERHDLRSHTSRATHLQQRQEEFEVGAAPTIDDGLHLVDHHDRQHPEQMGVPER